MSLVTTMGSSHRPFGYAFHEGHHHDAGGEVAGPPLLNEGESAFINSFFADPEADPLLQHAGGPDAAESQFAWPPVFHGTSAFFDAQPPDTRALLGQRGYQGFSTEHALARAVPEATEQDVMAASTLFQNAQGGPSQFGSGSYYPSVNGLNATSGLNGEMTSHGGHHPTNHAATTLPSPHSISSPMEYHSQAQQPRSSIDHHRSPSMPYLFGFGPVDSSAHLSPSDSPSYSHHSSIDATTVGVFPSLRPSMPPQPASGGPQPQQPSSRPQRAYRFGSDQNFNEVGFRQSGLEHLDSRIEDRLLADHLAMLDRVATETQVATGGHPSAHYPHPLQHQQQQHQPRPPHPRRKSYAVSASRDPDANDAAAGDSDGSARQRKRRRTITDDAPLGKTGIKRSASGASNAATAARARPGDINNGVRASSATTKRRKSSNVARINTDVGGSGGGLGGGSSEHGSGEGGAGGGAGGGDEDPQSAAFRTPRENLSEEQKRSNHIQSEQKRRNLIRQHFDTLNEIVPALYEACHPPSAGGGGGGSGSASAVAAAQAAAQAAGNNLSKNQVLQETADHLEGLIRSNDALEKRIRQAGWYDLFKDDGMGVLDPGATH